MLWLVAAGRGGGGVNPAVAEHGRDAPGAGRGRGFNHFGRGRAIGKGELSSCLLRPPKKVETSLAVILMACSLKHVPLQRVIVNILLSGLQWGKFAWRPCLAHSILSILSVKKGARVFRGASLMIEALSCNISQHYWPLVLSIKQTNALLSAEALPGASFQKWVPGAPAQAPAQEQPVSRGEDFIVPKLGTGPQRYKYNLEQMLSIYVTLSESSRLSNGIDLTSFADQLPDETTPHNLLVILEGIGSQMVGFHF